MYRLLKFENFSPKKLANREDEAEQKGVANYLRTAKQGLLQGLVWDTGKHLIGIDFDTAVDPRVCCYVAFYPPIDSHLSIYLVREYPEYLTGTGPYVLTIMDDDGLQFKQPFKTFAQGVQVLAKCLGFEPEIFTV